MAHFEKASKEGARIAEKTAEVQTDNFSAKDKHTSKVLTEDFVISIFIHNFINPIFGIQNAHIAVAQQKFIYQLTQCSSINAAKRLDQRILVHVHPVKHFHVNGILIVACNRNGAQDRHTGRRVASSTE